MSFLVAFSIVLASLIFAPKTYAIVILPAIVLIPLVKLIALIVGIFSVPIASAGVLLAKVTKKRKLAMLLSLLILICVGIIAALVLRKTHPANPWF